MKNGFTIFLLLTFGFIAGIYIPPYFQKNHQNISTTQIQEALDYTCSMHPHIHKSEEGDCPICGMSLVLNKKQVSNYQGVSISPIMQNNLGIKTTKVKRRTIYKPIRSYGYIKQLENINIKKITSPLDAVVTSINTQAQKEVKKGQSLLILSSTTWRNTQQQLLNALKQQDINEIRSISQLLQQIGMSLADIQRLKTNKKVIPNINIRAEKDGQVTALHIKEGQHVKRSQALLEIAPLYPIITYAEMFEGQWQWLKPGQAARMQIRSIPDVEWHGQVLDVDDIVASRSRTLKSRIGFKLEPGIQLRSGMQTAVTILSNPRENVLSVPYDVVIRNGIYNHVIVLNDDGFFMPQRVKVGLSDDHYVEIVSGLEENQRVVASGQFLLDSESNLLGELNRMSPSLNNNTIQ